MREQKNWVKKSAKNSYHDNITLCTEKFSFSHNNYNNELLIIMIIITK